MHLADHVAVRPASVRLVDPRLASRVVVPSNDVLTAEDRRELAAAEPLSWLHAQQRTSDHGGDLAATMAASRQHVDRLLGERVFGPVRRPRFVWYRLAAGELRQTGLVVELDVDAYRSGRVLRHEATRVDRERQLAAYRREVGVTSSPVALGMEPRAPLRALATQAAAREPAVDVELPDGERHTMWTVEAPDAVAAVAAAVADLDRTWVVDGHHRLAAAASVAADGPAAAHDPRRWVLAVLFPLDELRSLAFHRVVTLGTGPADARARLAQVGRLTPMATPTAPADAGAVAVCVEGAWHRLDLHPAAGDGAAPAGPVGAALLQARVLGPALGVTEPRTDPRLAHLAGGLADLAAACARPGVVGLALRPLAMDRLTAVAAAGDVLPPKSTRFHPKVRSGLLLRHLRRG